MPIPSTYGWRILNNGFKTNSVTQESIELWIIVHGEFNIVQRENIEQFGVLLTEPVREEVERCIGLLFFPRGRSADCSSAPTTW